MICDWYELQCEFVYNSDVFNSSNALGSSHHLVYIQVGLNCDRNVIFNNSQHIINQHYLGEELNADGLFHNSFKYLMLRYTLHKGRHT